MWKGEEPTKCVFWDDSIPSSLNPDIFEKELRTITSLEDGFIEDMETKLPEDEEQRDMQLHYINTPAQQSKESLRDDDICLIKNRVIGAVYMAHACRLPIKSQNSRPVATNYGKGDIGFDAIFWRKRNEVFSKADIHKISIIRNAIQEIMNLSVFEVDLGAFDLKN